MQNTKENLFILFNHVNASTKQFFKQNIERIIQSNFKLNVTFNGNTNLATWEKPKTVETMWI